MPVWPVATRWRPKSTADRGLPRLNEQYDLYQRTNWLRGLATALICNFKNCSQQFSRHSKNPAILSVAGACNHRELTLPPIPV